MGDRYEGNFNCAYCGELNEDVYYAPTCSFYTFKCVKCNNTNFITEMGDVKKIENTTLDDVSDAFMSASNMMWDETQLKRIIKNDFEALTEGISK